MKPNIPATSRMVKVLCRFGGKFMPRLSDGDLHYTGGLTQIIIFCHEATFDEFYSKMEDAYGGPVVICYQLPDRSLHDLVSISSVEDFDKMMGLCDWLPAASGYGFTKLRVFLFATCNTNMGNNCEAEDNYVVFGKNFVEAFNEANAFSIRAESATSDTTTSDDPSGVDAGADGGFSASDDGREEENATISPKSDAGDNGFIKEEAFQLQMAE